MHKTDPSAIRRTWVLPPQVKTRQVNGYEMAYIERGSGVPVVLVHGAVSDYRHWSSQIGPFSQRYRTIAVSLRHFYPEPWDGEGVDFSLRQHAADLASFIKALNAGPVHVVGHSLGADIVLILAIAHPELIRSMVLAEPAPLNELLPKTAAVATWIEQRHIVFSSARECLEQGDLDGGVGKIIDAVSDPDTWENTPQRQKQRFLDNAWSIKSLATDVQEPLTCSVIAEISTPVLFVKGGKCAKAYDEMMNALQRCLKHDEKVVIPNAPHAMNRVNPKAFNRAVLGFFARH